MSSESFKKIAFDFVEKYYEGEDEKVDPKMLTEVIEYVYDYPIFRQTITYFKFLVCVVYPLWENLEEICSKIMNDELRIQVQSFYKIRKMKYEDTLFDHIVEEKKAFLVECK